MLNDNNNLYYDNEFQNEQNEGASRGHGFTGMDPKKQRDIASKGGKAAHKKGKAHEWNSDEAREAGRKGGQKR